MGMHRFSYKFLFALSFIFFSQPAPAQVPELVPLDYKLLYNVTWNNITIGRLRVSMKEDRFGYQMKVDTKTKGIMRLISSEMRVAEAKGRITESGEYIHSSYESRSQEKGEKGKDYTILTYDEQGDLASRTRVPEDKRRKPVPESDINRATDTVTAFLKFRKRVHRNMMLNQRDTKFDTYDGARLAELSVKVISRANTQAMGKHQPTINSVLKREPLQGYHEKEMKKFNEGDPTTHIYWSADERFIPLKIDLQLDYGTVSAVLKEVRPFDPPAKKKKK